MRLLQKLSGEDEHIGSLLENHSGSSCYSGRLEVKSHLSRLVDHDQEPAGKYEGIYIVTCHTILEETTSYD